ncbi:nucleoside hydrolase [Chamaesiphon sp.]|uniref:nucleoside hydrolase n=1 Tax=Chamaesiphon sp. TaxID=2814140 RepID=UPI003592F3A4
MNNIRRKCLLSWQIPSIGFGLTFLFGLGFSYSNRDIRAEVQSVGLVVFTVLVAVGSYFTIRAFRYWQRYQNKDYLKHAIAGLFSNLLLIFFTTSSIIAIDAMNHPTNTTKHSVSEFKPSLNASKLPVWIDTDPACGQGATNDVDDCWALMMALRSPELALRGISTTFGNTKGETALQVARQAIGHLGGAARTPIYAGSHVRGSPEWKSTQASAAISSLLRREKLTMIAQGPLTNIATVIINYPDLVKNIDRIIMVAGKRPGDLFHPGQQWWFHFRDFNIRKDTPAAKIVLDSGIPLVLTPFELATKVTITRSDLDKLASGDEAAQWLRQVSQPWMSFWEDRLHKQGFHPFDALAVGYVTMPDLFDCEISPARIGFSIFLEPFGLGHDLEVAPDIRGSQVYYCSDVDRRFKDRLIDRLISHKTVSNDRHP